MNENPFSYGNPIQDPARFIGRSDSIRQILNRLCSSAHESTSITGDYRVGKTSLLYALKDIIRNNLPSYCAVFYDLQKLSSESTPFDFWKVLFRLLEKEITVDELKGDINQFQNEGNGFDLFDIEDVFERIESYGIVVVLLLNEIECITSNPKFQSDFWGGLRSLAIRGNLALITSSTRGLADLLHSTEVKGSPIFNIFASVVLRVFSEDEFDEFLQKYMENSKFRFRENEKRFILDIAGRHPYYSQIAARFLYDAYLMGFPGEKRTGYTLQKFTDNARDTLTHSCMISSDQEKIMLTILALLAKSKDQKKIYEDSFRIEKLRDFLLRADMLIYRLVDRCLVLEDGSKYKIFSSVFSEIILSEMRLSLTSQQTYDEWLNNSENKNLLHNLRSSLGKEIDTILPKIKESYRDIIIGWLVNPSTGKAAFELLRGLF